MALVSHPTHEFYSRNYVLPEHHARPTPRNAYPSSNTSRPSATASASRKASISRVFSSWYIQSKAKPATVVDVKQQSPETPGRGSMKPSPKAAGVSVMDLSSLKDILSSPSCDSLNSDDGKDYHAATHDESSYFTHQALMKLEGSPPAVAASSLSSPPKEASSAKSVQASDDTDTQLYLARTNTTWASEKATPSIRKASDATRPMAILHEGRAEKHSPEISALSETSNQALNDGPRKSKRLSNRYSMIQILTRNTGHCTLADSSTDGVDDGSDLTQETEKRKRRSLLTRSMLITSSAFERMSRPLSVFGTQDDSSVPSPISLTSEIPDDFDEIDPRRVHVAKCMPYWAGRFVTSFDRRQHERVQDALQIRAQTCPPADDNVSFDEARLRDRAEALKELWSFCTTGEALKSFETFYGAMAEIQPGQRQLMDDGMWTNKEKNRVSMPNPVGDTKSEDIITEQVSRERGGLEEIEQPRKVVPNEPCPQPAIGIGSIESEKEDDVVGDDKSLVDEPANPETASAKIMDAEAMIDDVVDGDQGNKQRDEATGNNEHHRGEARDNDKRGDESKNYQSQGNGPSDGNASDDENIGPLDGKPPGDEGNSEVGAQNGNSEGSSNGESGNGKRESTGDQAPIAPASGVGSSRASKRISFAPPASQRSSLRPTSTLTFEEPSSQFKNEFQKFDAQQRARRPSEYPQSAKDQGPARTSSDSETDDSGSDSDGSGESRHGRQSGVFGRKRLASMHSSTPWWEDDDNPFTSGASRTSTNTSNTATRSRKKSVVLRKGSIWDDDRAKNQRTRQKSVAQPNAAGQSRRKSMWGEDKQEPPRPRGKSLSRSHSAMPPVQPARQKSGGDFFKRIFSFNFKK